ncbi:MAG TPA: trypsin-like peptidase domain-containing protein [Euzebyales bacterium]|nr:trypsin-like peptidase domain-containing protein [Euzebyales bacterium]
MTQLDRGAGGVPPGSSPPRRPPSFPRLPTVRRRHRNGRRLLSTVVIAGLAGGTVAIAADRVLDPGQQPATTVPERSATVATGSPQDDVAAGTVARVAQAVLPSVVRINRATTDRFEGSGNGSGVVYRAEGLIVTNHHVVEAPGPIEVVFADGQPTPAEIVGQDPLNDLAVIRVERDDLTPIAIDSIRGPRVGDLAIAVGSPFGLDATVTVGVVSALGRGIHAGAEAGGDTVYLPEVLQTDAPINPGNSGGALVDADGRLIGINSAILTSGQVTSAGVGFAIPVDTVVDVADELIATGRVRHPLLGVSGGPLSDQVADRLGVEAGAWIHDVAPGTPGARAGLAPDDVIVGLDGRAIGSMEELSIAVRDHEVGDRVTISYVRGGRQRTVDVVLVERAPDDPQ